MREDLSDYRRSYEKDELLEQEVPENPFQLFKTWFNQADTSDLVQEANAMNLATSDGRNFPKNRIVLLKSYDEKGFIFFTNYESEKGKALAENPQCCLSFFWPAFERQIIIQGKVNKIDRAASDEYFHSRPKGSQIGALASKQSSSIPSRESLEEKVHRLEQEFENKEVPLPEFWGGYLVTPINFEFWQGRKNRLHDRIFYFKDSDSWKFKRLSP